MHEIFFLSDILLTRCYFTCTCLVLEISLFGSIVVKHIVLSFFLSSGMTRRSFMSAHSYVLRRIVVKILYTPAPIKKNCAVFKNVCIHQCVQRCVYMYIVRTRFYTNFFIVSKRKHNDQFSLKGLKKNVRFRFNKNCKNVYLKIGIQSRHTKTLFG